MMVTLPRLALVGALAALGIVGGVVSCDGDPTLPDPGGEIIVAFGEPLDRWPADGWDFDDAVVVDDSLRLTISYAGGCRTHELWLLAVDGFVMLPDAGLSPTVAVPLRVAHDAHGDPCEAYITRTETFGLDPLHAAFRDRYGDIPGRIILRIPVGQGSADTTAIDFTFQ